MSDNRNYFEVEMVNESNGDLIDRWEADSIDEACEVVRAVETLGDFEYPAQVRITKMTSLDAPLTEEEQANLESWIEGLEEASEEDVAEAVASVDEQRDDLGEGMDTRSEEAVSAFGEVGDPDPYPEGDGLTEAEIDSLHERYRAKLEDELDEILAEDDSASQSDADDDRDRRERLARRIPEGTILYDESHPDYGDGLVEVVEFTGEDASTYQYSDNRGNIRTVAECGANASYPADDPVVMVRYCAGSDKEYAMPLTRLAPVCQDCETRLDRGGILGPKFHETCAECGARLQTWLAELAEVRGDNYK